jgi:aspartyl-tRNA(Asn)/glutamyl-tRNA(Gln) amidotransferase subunit C
MSHNDNNDIVEYVANLARIELSSEEKEYIGPQLSEILDYIEKLDQLEVEDVEPKRRVFPQDNILREDKAEDKNYNSKILANAPEVQDNHFKVPKVI